MRIDAHCHIFDDDCVPLAGVLASRFGIAVGKRAARLIGDRKQGKTDTPWRDYFNDIFVDPQAFLDAFTNRQDKDNCRYFLEHPANFIAFLNVGISGMRKILNGMMNHSPGIDIWVPLMMDITHGYPRTRPAMPFDKQREIVSRLTLAAQGRIMPFYAFDPRAENPVERAKAALKSQGFVGIKLYPPLGYKPCGNDNDTIENALMALYEYCCRDHSPPIPITAHCSWSAGIFSNAHVPGIPGEEGIKTYYRNMAHPRHWEKVLQQFPALKINLAHFGGVGEWECLAKGRKPRENWVDPIIELMKKYDNVYADLSFHGLPATPIADQYKRVLLEKIDELEHKVLLGSDWYMSRLQCRLEDYWHGFETLVPDLFQMATGDNAISFLRSEAAISFFPQFFSSNNGTLKSEYRHIFAD